MKILSLKSFNSFALSLICLLSVLAFSSCTCLDKNFFSLEEVIDGDSIRVLQLNCQECKKLEIRLLGIDAPEYSQDPWGQRARNFVLERIGLGHKLRIEFKGIDKYNRHLAYVFFDDAYGKELFLNEELLANGYADIFILGKSMAHTTKLKAAYSKARRQELNIWDMEKGIKIRPYRYRKLQKVLKSNNK